MKLYLIKMFHKKYIFFYFEYHSTTIFISKCSLTSITRTCHQEFNFESLSNFSINAKAIEV